MRITDITTEDFLGDLQKFGDELSPHFKKFGDELKPQLKNFADKIEPKLKQGTRDLINKGAGELKQYLDREFPQDDKPKKHPKEPTVITASKNNES